MTAVCKRYVYFASRTGVNIRPAVLHTVCLCFRKYSWYVPPSCPEEVLEMLMVMGLRYANSELQIQYAAANTDGGGEQQIREEDREQIVLQANLR